MAPRRVGLAPEQGKGIEYEFDLLLEMSQEHICSVIKDRTGKFQDQLLDKPDEKFGKALINWLSEGAAPEKVQNVTAKAPAKRGRPAKQKEEKPKERDVILDTVMAYIKQNKIQPANVTNILKYQFKVDEYKHLPIEKRAEFLTAVETALYVEQEAS